MTGPALLILSEYGPPDRIFSGAIGQGRVLPLNDTELSDEVLDNATALITTMHLDQVGFGRQAAALERLLGRGGRIFFNGHLAIPFLPELAPFVPLSRRRRQDYDLVRLADHPIFEGVDIKTLVTRKGVAGFYGRGHVPLPPGAMKVTGLGPERVPVDWEWRTPRGGAIFMHAGNELWSMGGNEDGAMSGILVERVVDWSVGLDQGRFAA
ncbi:MAG: hypothetical protein ACHQAY_02270 [Hyphomicrobiales bacterium]